MLRELAEKRNYKKLNALSHFGFVGKTHQHCQHYSLHCGSADAETVLLEQAMGEEVGAMLREQRREVTRSSLASQRYLVFNGRDGQHC